MQYDPIKRTLGNVFNRKPVLRKLFYRLLDLLLLRTWHIKRELKQWRKINNQTNGYVLDAGSGFGQYVYFMSKMLPNYKIKGIDIKEEQIEDCEQFFEKTGKKQQVSFQLVDLTAFVEQNSFDLILSVDVMEHIEDDVQVFRNFYASLKPGGMLLVSTPSDKGGSDVHHEHDHSFIDEHVRDGYGIDEIKDKLIAAGFRHVDARYNYGTPGKISWKLSMKFPIQLLNISKWFFIIIPFYFLFTYPIAFVLNYFDLYGTHKTGTGLIVKAMKAEKTNTQ